MDLDGADITMLTAALQWSNHYTADEMDGEILNDAIYKRDMQISEQFNVNIIHELVHGMMAGMEDVHNRLYNSVMAGDCSYDIFNASSAYIGSLVLEGMFRDQLTLPYLKPFEEWYFSRVNTNLRLGGRLYISSGAYNFHTLSQNWCILFNRQLVSDYALTSPYELVNGGAWTFEAMQSMGNTVTSDMDGNGKMDGSDRYGMIGTQTEPFYAYTYGMGRLIISDGSSGSPTLTDLNDRDVSIMDRIRNLYESGIYFGTPSYEPTSKAIPMFANGQGLFFTYNLSILENPDTREAGDFGILPLPKYDEEQKQYYNSAFADISAVPYVCLDPETSALIIEAMNRLSFTDVLPTYYDIVLQNKLTRDDESRAMLELFVPSTTMEAALLFYQTLGVDIVMCGPFLKTSYATWWVENETALRERFETILTSLSQLP
ncbi:MAG: hypothetical protein K6D94_03230 [Clostridiales bacterium]|nr:hypothetical protein [Clostridiales bacterium]